VIMLMMHVTVTIRTGRCAPLSTPRFTGVPATGLAQNYTPPEVARQFTQFLGKGHGLIKIGQELVECTSSSHRSFSPCKEF